MGLAIAGAILCCSLSSGAEERSGTQLFRIDREEEVKGRIEGDRLEFLEKGQVIEATGNVQISYGQFWMRADRVRFDRETKEVLAEGKVFFTDGKSRLEGEKLEYNTDSGRGILYQGNGFLSPSLWITGMEIRREDESTYHLTDTSLTSCPPEEEGPSEWEVRAGRATVRLNANAVCHDATFRIKGVPILYSPLLIGPASERQSGFLIPQPGYSDRDGFLLKTAYFWAINPSQDATFSLNYRTERGLEEGLEYRYILSEKARGYFSGNYTYDELDHTNNWKVQHRHQQEIRPNLEGKLNLNLQNTSDYQRIYSTDTAIRSQRLLASEGYVAQNWSNESVLLRGNYTKDLSQHDHLYRLPELDVLSFRQPWDTLPLYFHLNSSATYFEGWSQRDVGRFDLYPRLTLPLDLGGLASLTPMVALRETFYTREEEAHHSSSRELYHLQARLESRLARDFKLGGERIERLRHTIEPMVAYEYIPEVEQGDLVQYDALDFISPQNGLTYSLTNRLWAWVGGAEGKTLREVLALRLSQSYNIHGPRQEYPYPELGIAYNDLRTSLGLRYSDRRFSDVNGQLKLSPWKSMSLVLDANYDPEGHHIDTLDPYLQVQFSKYLNVIAGYHYAPELDIHAYHGLFSLKIRDFATLSYYSRYDFARETFLEHKIDLTYFGRCWSVTLAYVNNPDQEDFRFSFDLKSISGVK